MKKVKMIVTSIVVLAIVGSAFAFNARKVAKYCVTTSGGAGNCYTIFSSKRTTSLVSVQLKYVTCWDENDGCNNTSPCNTMARFTTD